MQFSFFFFSLIDICPLMKRWPKEREDRMSVARKRLRNWDLTVFIDYMVINILQVRSLPKSQCCWQESRVWNFLFFPNQWFFFFIKRFNFELRKSDCRKPFCRVRFRFGFRLIFFFVIKLKQGPNGEKVEGSKGLTTFLIYTHKQGLTFCWKKMKVVFNRQFLQNKNH